MTATTQDNQETYLAKIVAGEDLRGGDYVAVFHETVEYPSWIWCGDDSLTAREEPVRVCFRARDFELLEVKAICLPFVFVKKLRGGHRTLDLRQCQLVWLADGFVAEIRKRTLRRGKKKRKSRKK